MKSQNVPKNILQQILNGNITNTTKISLKETIIIIV